MTRPLYSASLAIILGASLLTACGEQAEAPVAETPAPEAQADPNVESRTVTVEDGAVTSTVVVEKSTADSDEAFVAVTGLQVLSAKVVSINPETREVVLVGEDGIEFEILANEKTNNLDQVSPGDQVNAEFLESVTIELVKGGDIRPMDTTAQRDVQSEEGEMPARAEVQQTVNIYTVEAIDIEANTFQLKDVNGDIEEFSARDPANLAKASLGDAVVITTTQAEGVLVTSPAGEG